MNCPRCQQSIRDGARFCDSCGFSIGALSAADDTPSALAETLKVDPLIGHTLDGRYQLIEQLGKGGMGVVYRAERVLVGDEVAVKILRSEFVAEPEAVARFRREARAAARLRHPNVVVIYDYGEARGDDAPAFIVMELLRGESLRDVLKRERRLEPQRAVTLMRAICAGIGTAHRNDIVHRDIKPDNVIVLPPDEEEGRERETVKVVDFGIAKLRDPAGGGTLTQKGFQPGTIYYMSPEQCRGDDLDARSDVYSLGALCYEMLAGAPPFVGETRTGVISKHLFDSPPPFPAELHVSAALSAVVIRALAKDPAARQADASMLGRELQAAEREEQEAQQRRAEEERRQAEAEKLRLAKVEAEKRRLAEEARAREAETRQRAIEQQQRREAEAAERRRREAQAAEMPHTVPAPSIQSTQQPSNASPEPPANVKTLSVAHTPAPSSTPTPTIDESAITPKSSSKRGIMIALIILLVVGAAIAIPLLLNRQGEIESSNAGVTANNKPAVGPTGKTTSEPTPPPGMVYVPGGTFTIGRNDGDEYERPAYQATINPFFIDTHEVTNEEYAKFVWATGWQPPPTWINKTYPAGAALKPVTGVTWEDARAFARWSGKRLPTEDEWEFAARGKDGRRYPWGNEWRAGLANADGASSGMADVGAYRGASPFGAFDMVGNAWEWTDSKLIPYPGGTLPIKVSDNLKVIRGGAYLSNRNQATTTYRRGWRANEETDYSNTSFRCVKEIGESSK
ncbi:MAG TPA: SUMF1/EgtB/PvdO family nonheme iron enzyme [Pyrinomonadaceae bacterium]|jgi:serine/threonine-protein kinase